MELKSEYTLDELLLNESFLNYYFQKNEEAILDWEDWFEGDSMRTALVQEAFLILDRLSLKWQHSDIEDRYERVREEIFSAKNTSIQKRRIGWVWYAAVASLVLAVGAWSIFNQQTPAVGKYTEGGSVAQKTEKVSGAITQKLEKVIEKAKNIRYFRLPDGTRVQLSAGSDLKLAKDFGKVERVVYLDGQAQFEVAHDASRPFRVHTEGVVTTALGTVFIVKSATAERAGQVVLIEGKVKVSESDNEQVSILEVGETLNFYKRERRIAFTEVEKIDLKSVTNWQDDAVFSIEKIRLADVFNRLSQNYGVQFVGVDGFLANYWVTGMFDMKLPLKDLLDVLAFSNDFQYEIKGNTVVIKR